MFELSIERLARKELLAHGNAVVDAFVYELNAQGHRNTGRLERSIAAHLTDDFAVEVVMLDYALDLDKGVPASVVKGWLASPQMRRKYLAGLYQWARNKKAGLNRNELTQFVFAVARKAAKEGHPTRGSLRFSQTGKRTDFIGAALRKVPINDFLGALGDLFVSSAIRLDN